MNSTDRKKFIPLAKASLIITGYGADFNEDLYLRTLFEYPNGKNIDIFVQNIKDTDQYQLSDRGFILAYLFGLGVYDYLYPNENVTNQINDICKQMNVIRRQSEFTKPITDINDLESEVIQLIKACVSILEIKK